MNYLIEQINGFNYEKPAFKKEFKTFGRAKSFGLKLLRKSLSTGLDCAVFLYSFNGENLMQKFEIYSNGKLDEYNI